MTNLSFNQKCYELLRKIPKGKVTTYKIIANKLNTKAYRAVGNAMNKNPFDTNLYPCHRIVNSDGKIGGYAHEIQIKIQKLESEGVKINNGEISNFNNVLFKF